MEGLSEWMDEWHESGGVFAHSHICLWAGLPATMTNIPQDTEKLDINRRNFQSGAKQQRGSKKKKKQLKKQTAVKIGVGV